MTSPSPTGRRIRRPGLSLVLDAASGARGADDINRQRLVHQQIPRPSSSRPSGQQVIDGGHDQQGDQGRERQPEEDHGAHGHPALIPRPHGDHQRHRAYDGGQRGHQDGPQPTHRAAMMASSKDFAGAAG